MKPLYLDWNLGLGDAILCNGLVRTLAKQWPERAIAVPCYAHNYPTVAHMFSDLPTVRVVVTEADNGQYSDPGFEKLSIGINNPAWGTNPQWDQAFYEFAGVPFDAKWDAFFVPESGREMDAYPYGYLLRHEDMARGFKIDDALLGIPLASRGMGFIVDVAPGVRDILTDWRFVIGGAQEIHVIDSSFMHLAELMPTTGKIFYHKYARAKGSRQHTDAVLRKKWEILE